MNYLTKAVGENAVGAAVTAEAVGLLGDPDGFQALAANLEPRQLEDLLRRLGDYGDEVDQAAIPAAVAVLFNQLPRLPEESRTFLDPSLESLVAPLADTLLARLPPSLRDGAAETGFSDINSLYGRFRFLMLFGDHGRQEQNNHPRFSAEATRALRARLRDQLLASTARQLADERQLPRMLFLVVQEGGVAGREHLNALLDDDDFLMHVLVKFARREVTVDLEGTPQRSHGVRLDYDSSLTSLAAEALAVRVRALDASVALEDLNDDERVVLDLATRRANDESPPREE